ncbi:uncharacterized protein LOC124354667 [Homalodisca vitripennis]|uniref:uncharacterized protein LOC124354667 n=1 Tax=Homalodisca vitripennis TaxID=197043 RepID=UPI001EEAD4DB|nr:uncharacterized protein LOC124354667 [Homalodisca vitripennis]
MRVPRLKFFCCCCSLSLGTKIIGWLNVIVAVLIILVSLERIINGHLEILEALRIAVWDTIVQGFISLTLSILLLKGAYERKPKYVKVWVYFSVVMLLIICVPVILKRYYDVDILITLLSDDKYLYVLKFQLTLNLYFTWIVYSFYRELIQDPNRC